MRERWKWIIRFVLWLLLFAIIGRVFAYGIGIEKKRAEEIAAQQREEQEQRLIIEERQKEEQELLAKKKKAREMAKKRKKALKRARRQSFEASMKQFPSDYQEALEKLHKQHPKWHFEAVAIDDSWLEAVSNESVTGKNSIQIDPHENLSYVSMAEGAYNKETDTFVAVDAGGRYTPSKEAVAYYMDPRNFLTEDKIFQFEDLSYNSYHKEEVVGKMLENTFMQGAFSWKKGQKKTVSRKYAETFMVAGKKAEVNPYHLVSRVIQEVGSSGSASVSGSGGYYNFYNIGATDSPGGDAVAKGLAFAAGSGSYDRPWTNPYDAIVGGAQFLGEEYINVGQDTLYFQKWNVVNKESLYWHQYMSNIEAPVSEATMIYRAYKEMNCLDEELVFRIPVYRAMPVEVSSLPEKKENTNCYLASISVTSGNKKFLTKPRFTYKKTSYKIEVPNKIEEVDVVGKSASEDAIVQGNGKKTLRVGSNVILLTCVAQDGSKKVYSILIIRDKKEQMANKQEVIEQENPENMTTEDLVEEDKTTEKESPQDDVAEEDPAGDEVAVESEQEDNEIQGGVNDGVSSGSGNTNEEESSVRNQSVGNPSDGNGFSVEMSGM
jgi:beta-N-acetylglucosaminidase